MQNQIGPYKAIREWFESNGRKVTTDELKQLTKEDVQELAPMCAKELGAELVLAVTA